ncbi:MAG: NusG domain II-containing protein, partial [Clostridiales bacterium]|nr:NusG domain II-containing protein [Clostridiales bacterium]
GGRAVIKRDGAPYTELPLRQNALCDVFSLDGALLNTVEIRDGAARMAKADCPDGLCLKQGQIRHTNETVVCLPNRVTVEIIGGERGAFDGIAQ